MKFLLGEKQNMTQLFREDGTVVPVTKVLAGPCVITQVKTKDKDGVQSVQIGFGSQKLFRVSKPLQGHLKGIGSESTTVRFLRDFKTDQTDLQKGDRITVANFKAGEKVQVVGTSKGKGFQGVVKRHGFHGGKKTHGGKDQERMPGAIGAGGVQRVFKDQRMAGRMGTDRVTVKNLEIIKIDTENNELYLKGAIPGGRHALLLISTNEGKVEVEKMPEIKEQPVTINEQPTANNEQTVESVVEEIVAPEVVETPVDEQK